MAFQAGDVIRFHDKVARPSMRGKIMRIHDDEMLDRRGDFVMVDDIRYSSDECQVIKADEWIHYWRQKHPIGTKVKIHPKTTFDSPAFQHFVGRELTLAEYGYGHWIGLTDGYNYTYAPYFCLEDTQEHKPTEVHTRL